MRGNRKHNYNDYEPDIDIYHDRVQINQKYNKNRQYEIMSQANNDILYFADIENDYYIRKELNCYDWTV